MLEKKKIFMFDIDGTLAVDASLYPGSRELLEYIRDTGGYAFYITNNSTKSRKDYVKKFAAWDIETTEDQFMTASYATVLDLSSHYTGKKIYVVGTPSFVTELREAGIRVTEKEGETDVAAVLVGFDQTLTYGKIQEACRLLSDSAVEFLATSPDLTCPVSFGFVPDCGSICRMLETAVGRSPRVIGKPSARVVQLCLEQCGGCKEEAVVVGDRLYTDIACGINAGVDTAVVFTGEAKPEDLKDTEWKPAWAFPTILEFYQAVKGTRP